MFNLAGTLKTMEGLGLGLHKASRYLFKKRVLLEHRFYGGLKFLIFNVLPPDDEIFWVNLLFFFKNGSTGTPILRRPQISNF